MIGVELELVVLILLMILGWSFFSVFEVETPPGASSPSGW